MADDDDFTFCRVGPPVDDIEVQNVASEVKGMHIDAGNDSNGGRIWKIDASARKEETVSSLSFTVIDASTRKETDQQTRLKGKEPSGSSDTAKNPVRKSAPRAKVPFEKGYSQVDWLKLTRTHPDLAGLNGQSSRRLISLKEVKQNQSGSVMWTVLKGRVYNIAPYMKFHPGGVDMLMKAVGKDCTSLFNKYHAWVNAEFLMEKCLVGILDTDK